MKGICWVVEEINSFWKHFLLEIFISIQIFILNLKFSSFFALEVFQQFLLNCLPFLIQSKDLSGSQKNPAATFWCTLLFWSLFSFEYVQMKNWSFIQVLLVFRVILKCLCKTAKRTRKINVCVLRHFSEIVKAACCVEPFICISFSVTHTDLKELFSFFVHLIQMKEIGCATSIFIVNLNQGFNFCGDYSAFSPFLYFRDPRDFLLIS